MTPGWTVVPAHESCDHYANDGLRCLRCGAERVPAPARSARPEVRNPVLALASAQALQQLPPEARAALAGVLLDIRREAHGKAELSWRQRKGPMAAYWRAVAVYAGHIARATRPATGA